MKDFFKNQKNWEIIYNMLDNLHFGLIVTDSDLINGPKILYVNDCFTFLTGYSYDEIIGKTPRILQGPKTDRTVLDKLKKDLQSVGYFKGGFTYNYKKDGSEYVNEWMIDSIRDQDGVITHYYALQRDITKIYEHYKTFQETAKRVRDLAERTNEK